MKAILIIGNGYCGSRLAALHAAAGDSVTVTSRTGAAPAGMTGLALDLDAATLPPLPAADLAYYTVPPPPTGIQDPRLDRLLKQLAPSRTFVYFSATSVYGDCGGARVDEQSPADPTTDRGRRRLAAETSVQQWAAANGVVAAILRAPAIYGPGRLPLERLRQGMAVPDSTDTGPGNRIHVDDLCAAAFAIAHHGQGGTWNISDGNPMPTAEFTEHVAALAGLPAPRRVPLDSPEILPGQRAFLADSRRIDNRKLLSLPGFHLRYADPIAGIRESIAK